VVWNDTLIQDLLYLSEDLIFPPTAGTLHSIKDWLKEKTAL
jgi:hypothetical protein